MPASCSAIYTKYTYKMLFSRRQLQTMTRRTAGERRDAMLDIHAAPGHLIRRAQQIAVALFAEQTAGYDITPIQFALLSELATSGPMDQVTLASHIAIDVATLGQVAQRLAQRGLVAREADVNDRRRKLIVLIAGGRALLRKVLPLVATTQNKILAPLSPTEQVEFCRLLTRLVHQNNEQSRAPMRRPGATPQ